MESRWYFDNIEKTSEEVENEVLEAVKEGKKDAATLRKILHELRQRDHKTERTCANCLHRKPIADFHLDTDEFCKECIDA